MAIAVLTNPSYKRWYGGGLFCAKWRHNCIQIEFIFWANYEHMNEAWGKVTSGAI